MIEKTKEKEKAIRLRREGRTYSEILNKIPVAKSTLSLWLKSVSLAKPQQQRITKKRLDAAKRGGLVKKNKRINLYNKIISKAEKEVGDISSRELWLIGIILYWAEGSKQKEWNVSQQLQFTNSDPLMVSLYIKWLRNCLKISKKDISFSLALHENNKHRLPDIMKFWRKVSGLNMGLSDKVYFKRHNRSGFRHNLGDGYYGTARVAVLKSTNLNREVAGWVRGIAKSAGSSNGRTWEFGSQYLGSSPSPATK